MINGITGTVMSVPADLVDTYRAAGHKLVAPAPAEEPEEKPADAPEKKTRTARKK